MSEIPQGLVLIDPSFVTGLLLISVTLTVIIIILIIIMAIKRYRTPLESNSIKDASNSRQPLLLMLGLSHFADILRSKDFIPEGVLERIQGKGTKKTTLRFQVPKNKKVPEIEVEHGKDPIKTREAFQNLLNLATEKVFLRGARVPILGVVSDKAVAVGLKALGAMTFYEKLEKLGSMKEKIKALKEVKVTSTKKLVSPDDPDAIPVDQEVTESYADLAEVFESLAQGVSNIDFNSIRTNFVDAAYDQTTQESISDRDQTTGRREASKGMETLKAIIPYIIVLLIAGGLSLAFVIVALKLL